jgi:hypothetical protein
VLCLHSDVADASIRRWPDTVAAGYISAKQQATSQESVQGKSDNQPGPRQRVRGELTGDKNHAAYEADQVDQFIHACLSLVLAKRLEVGGHPPAIWVMPAEALHDEIATRRHIAFQD